MALQPAVAQGVSDVPIINVPSGDDALVQADPQREVRQGGAAGEQHRGPRGVIVRAGHRIPVCVDNVLRQQQQRRARIRDCSEGLRHVPRVGVACYRRGADPVSRDCEKPVRGCLVDRGVLDVARVRVPNEAEAVRPCDFALQVGGEQRLGQGRLDVIKEGGLLHGLHGVAYAHPQAQQAPAVGVFGKLR